MTLAAVRRPTCEARSAARKASPITYTPPWKYRTTWRGSIPPTVISAAGTPPSAARVTVTSAGSGCADSSSRSSRRCSLTSPPAGKADCRRIASRLARCSVLTQDLPSVGLVRQRPRLARPCQSAAENSCPEAGHYQARRQAGEEASPDHGDSRDQAGQECDLAAQQVGQPATGAAAGCRTPASTPWVPAALARPACSCGCARTGQLRGAAPRVVLLVKPAESSRSSRAR